MIFSHGRTKIVSAAVTGAALVATSASAQVEMKSTSFVMGTDATITVDGATAGTSHLLLFDLEPGDFTMNRGQWLGLGFTPAFQVLSVDPVPDSNTLELAMYVPDDEALHGFEFFLQGVSMNRNMGRYRTSNRLDEVVVSQFDGGGASSDADWVLTPSSCRNVATGETINTGSPVQDVFGADQWSSSGKNRPELKTPGDVIELTPGDYEHFRITMSYDRKPGVERVNSHSDYQFGIDPQTVIRASQPGTVRVQPNPVGGSQTHYLEWGGAVTYEGLTFVGDDTMGVGSERPASLRWNFHQGFRDFWFYDCNLEGGFNFETNTGPDCKWGVLTYEMGRSAYDKPGWIWSGGSITGIREEHANYFHNVLGDILVENMTMKWCGRTAFQMANRIGEGPAGVGDLTFRNVYVEDVCLQDGGGGSAFSFNGRHTGTILMDNVTVRLGANPNLHERWNQNITGALVIHAGEDTDDLPNGHVIVKDCDFQVGPHFVGKNSARRGNIQVDECMSFSLINTRVAQLGNNPREALDIEPDRVRDYMIFDDDCEIIGECIYDGDKFPDYQTMLNAIKNEPKVRIQ